MLASDAVRVGTAASGSGRAPRVLIRPAHALAATGLAALALLLALLVARPAGVQRQPLIPVARPAGPAGQQVARLPAAALAPVSNAVGAADPAYRVDLSHGGLAATSAAQRMRIRFAATGISLTSGKTRVRLDTEGFGYPGAVTALPKDEPRAHANRVTYARADVTESYVNGPLGLEQGFTIGAAPAGRASGPLTLSIALSGNAHATLAANGQSVSFAAAGGPTLSYSGLRATDARGRVLRSSLALSGGHILLRVNTRGASYPLRIDPFIHQGEKLTGSGLSGPYGYVGMSVALSADGNTALVGAPADGTYTEYKGAAFVFTRSGSTWTQQGEKLTGGGETAADGSAKASRCPPAATPR